MRATPSVSAGMRTPAVASAVMHASFLVIAFIGLPDFFRQPPPLEPEPVMVEFEAIDKKAAAPKVGNPPPQPKDAPIAEETTKAPPPKTADPPPAPPPPKPVEEAAVQPPPPPPKPPEQAKPEPPKPAEEIVALKPKEAEPPKVEKPPEPPKPAPEVKKVEPTNILKNQQSPNKVQTPEQQTKPPAQVTRQAPAAPQLAAVVTASEVEGVRQKIRPCWNFPAGVKDQNALIVTLIVQMNQDGTPVKADLKDTGRYNNDPAYRAAADAAHRAIMNPKCQPWLLAPEKFANWRTITFNFDPRDY